jgi:GNAT superfamily N-acetyltransferase
LTQDLNKASKCFALTWNDKPTSFIAILPLPSGTLQNAFRVSRLVVLPDYQGLGFGIKLLNYIGAMYKTIDKKLYIKTSNPSLFMGMSRNKDNWFLCDERNDIEKIKLENAKEGQQRKLAITKSYKYIGESSTLDTSIVTFSADAYKDYSQRQISMF